MNLVFDLGNTQLKLGVFDKDVFISYHIIAYDKIEELNAIISSIDITGIALSKVKNIPSDLIKILDALNKEILFFSSTDTKLPIDIVYETPETLGHDRICNVVAAHLLYPNKNTLVVDLGTCNKFDFINSEGQYLGGSISPGLKMRFSSMNYYTDKLPLLEPTITDAFIGNSTKKSMISGAYYGIIGEIKYFIKQYEREFNDIEVIITGGFARYFEKALKNHIFAHPYLTLIGLNYILNIQDEK